MDPSERRSLERRVLAELRRFHRRQPLEGGIRIDALVTRLQEGDRARPPSRHRGGQRPAVELATVVDAVERLVTGGAVVRDGRRVRIAGERGRAAPDAEERIERMLGALRRGWPTPPRAEAAARDAGVAPHLLAGMRRSGRLVRLAPGIDLPADVHAAAVARVAALRASGPVGVARVRDELGCSRRVAAALLASLPQD